MEEYRMKNILLQIFIWKIKNNFIVHQKDIMYMLE